MTKKTEDGIAPSLAKISELRTKLASGTDALNQRIREFEKRLIALGLGVAATTLLWQHEEAGRSLRFCKWGGEWRLVLVDWEDGDETEIEPLLNASREDRLLAVQEFPALVGALIAAAEAECTRIANASQSVDYTIEVLKRVTS